MRFTLAKAPMAGGRLRIAWLLANHGSISAASKGRGGRVGWFGVEHFQRLKLKCLGFRHRTLAFRVSGYCCIAFGCSKLS